MLRVVKGELSMETKKCPMTGKEISPNLCFESCCIVDCSQLLSESNLVLEKGAGLKAETKKD